MRFVLLTIAVVAVAACGGSAAVTTTTAAPSTTTTSRAASSTTTASSASATVTPVADAAELRDRLLDVAQHVDFQSPTPPSFADSKIVAAWQARFPDLKQTLFPDQPADPSTASIDTSFLIAKHGYDQLQAFAVMDTKGTCAAGAAVKPSIDGGTKASDDKFPTKFVTIDMSSATKCSAEQARALYQSA